MDQTQTQLETNNYKDKRNWRKHLEPEDLCIFSSYVFVDGIEHSNTFRYVNPTDETEIVVGLLLDKSGNLPNGLEPVVLELAPGEWMNLDANAELEKAGITQFEGSFQAMVTNKDKTIPLNNKHMHHMSTWWGPDSAAQILTAGHKSINVTGKKDKKRFVMFCSAVHDSEEVQTRVAVFNHATEADYYDKVSFTPVLHNLQGESLTGESVTMEPFGSVAINVDTHFGQAGRELLKKTDGRGSLTVNHTGNTLGTLFFHVNKKTGTILSGQHTQPAVPAVFRGPGYNVWVEWLGQKVPLAGHLIPALSYMKHHKGWWRIFYPHHSLFLGTFLDWFRQSRFVVWSKFVLRLFYFLAKKKGKIDEINLTPETSHNRHVIQHNFRDNLRLFQFSRGRLEKLIYPLLSVPTLNKKGKLLSIGPKNEGEVLLLEAQGFRDVEGIDLFTYSPKIKMMDMHDMKFADNTFDTVFSGATITYSYNAQKVVDEIIRVAKDGALVLISFGLFPPEEKLKFDKGQLDGGVKQLLSMFGDKLGHVYWWNEGVVPDKKSKINTVIFQLNKNGATDVEKNFPVGSYSKEANELEKWFAQKEEKKELKT